MNLADFVTGDWLGDAGARAILGAVKKAGGEARFVGGCVRDTLLGCSVGDSDLAVNLAPDRVSAALSAAGIKVVPTGIDHGTLTAVVGGKPYEITSLRRDVATDGRHAEVEFTDDWQADAARRDFTINAIYADGDGRLYDYFGGRADIADRRVRFIGDAHSRIREDVLRILRFFRFSAWFGGGALDGAGLTACRELAPLIPQLSVERVWREIAKLLLAPDPAGVWQVMMQAGVVAHMLPQATNIERLKKLVSAEVRWAEADSLRRLAALVGADKAVAARWHLSNRESERLSALARAPGLLRGKLDPVPLRRALYHEGQDAVRDGLLLLAADDGVDIGAALELASDWEKPVFPLRGDDALALGLAGPQVGAALRAVEDWWLAADARPARDECLAQLKSITTH